MNGPDEYFEWLLDKVGYYERYSPKISYLTLLDNLYNTEFTYTIKKDKNRALAGQRLRERYLTETEESYLPILTSKPCSVLEMMVALAIACEEKIMDDPAKGNRTGTWFWGMINNLGLGGMIDEKFDEKEFNNIIKTFLRRKYEPDGKGGLFRVKGSKRDLRRVEIWYQLCWYLDTLI